MKIFTTKKEVLNYSKKAAAKGRTIGLVPTMGFLHDGHMSLVKKAKKKSDRVIVSIFVNPTQFGDPSDLDKYPRNMEADLAKLKAAKVNAVFAPEVDEVYDKQAQTIVETTKLSRIMMGKIRPGHFRGVATIVTKLFNICQPDLAFFGEKDYQQLQVIKRMVKDLDMPIKIIGVPTMREKDGLAMSSRNVRLTKSNRKAATVLSRSLFEAEKICAIQATTTAKLDKIIRKIIASDPKAVIKGIDIKDAESLASVNGVIKQPVVAMLAVQFGDIMLIDQRVFVPKNR